MDGHFRRKKLILCKILHMKLAHSHASAWGRLTIPQSLLPSNPEISMKFLFAVEILPTQNRKLTYSASAVALSNTLRLSPQHLILH